MSKSKKIAITIGDPAGVGPEIILNWLNRSKEFHSKVEVIAHKNFCKILPSLVSYKTVGDENFSPIAGFPSIEGSRVAAESLEAAAKGCIDGRYCAVVTAPISKAEMKKIGFNFAGQTEFFADRWGGKPVMAFAGKHLLMSLVTWHEPLRNVPDSINYEKIERAVKSASILAEKTKGIKFPRIAVCGLNPHAGENGILGFEEIEIINPTLEKLRVQYKNLSEALPPDTVFERTLKGEFDAVVAMYHDQGLAPLKALDFDNAVNVSMNLDHIRTSPDHGTAFGIAGKGIASDSSFGCAVELALALSK